MMRSSRRGQIVAGGQGQPGQCPGDEGGGSRPRAGDQRHRDTDCTPCRRTAARAWPGGPVAPRDQNRPAVQTGGLLLVAVSPHRRPQPPSGRGPAAARRVARAERNRLDPGPGPVASRAVPRAGQGRPVPRPGRSRVRDGGVGGGSSGEPRRHPRRRPGPGWVAAATRRHAARTSSSVSPGAGRRALTLAERVRLAALASWDVPAVWFPRPSVRKGQQRGGEATGPGRGTLPGSRVPPKERAGSEPPCALPARARARGPAGPAFRVTGSPSKQAMPVPRPRLACSQSLRAPAGHPRIPGSAGRSARIYTCATTSAPVTADRKAMASPQPSNPAAARVTTPSGLVVGIPDGGRLVFGRGPDADLIVAAGRGLSRRRGDQRGGGGAWVANISQTHALYAERDGYRVRLPRMDEPDEPAGERLVLREGTALVGSRAMLDQGQPLAGGCPRRGGALGAGAAERAPAGGDVTLLPFYLDPIPSCSWSRSCGAAPGSSIRLAAHRCRERRRSPGPRSRSPTRGTSWTVSTPTRHSATGCRRGSAST